MMLARDIPKPEAKGVPTVYAAGDVNRDGVCDGFDPQDWDDYNDYGVGALAVDLDINRDGVVDSADRALVQGHADWALWTSHGRGSVSRLHNRRGYAGYEYDPATAQWHVRHRVLVSEMGRWNRRDPLGYVDGMSVYEYVGSMPVWATDPMGLAPWFPSYTSCQEALQRCFEQPRIKAEQERIQRAGRPLPSVRCANPGDSDCPKETCGYALPGRDYDRIRICWQHDSSNGDCGDICNTLMHEMIHARQFAEGIQRHGGGSGGYRKYIKLENHNRVQCIRDEVEAYSNDGNSYKDVCIQACSSCSSLWENHGGDSARYDSCDKMYPPLQTFDHVFDIVMH
ncbi:MAG: hypothetical protein KF864_06285 [Phycisphaeraceae bacterium]|nr:hypothetical protein [Phycisphaeraceae bacterium]